MRLSSDSGSFQKDLWAVGIDEGDLDGDQKTARLLSATEATTSEQRPTARC
jgi:hypothetical protein